MHSWGNPDEVSLCSCCTVVCAVLCFVPLIVICIGGESAFLVLEFCIWTTHSGVHLWDQRLRVRVLRTVGSQGSRLSFNAGSCSGWCQEISCRDFLSYAFCLLAEFLKPFARFWNELLLLTTH